MTSLVAALGSRLRRRSVRGVLTLGAEHGRQRAQLFELKAVRNESLTDAGGWILELDMAARDLRRFLKRENLALDRLDALPDDPAVRAVN